MENTEIEYLISTAKGDIIWRNGEVRTTKGLMMLLEVTNSMHMEEINSPAGMICDGVNHLEHEFCFKAIMDLAFDKYSVTKNVNSEISTGWREIPIGDLITD